MTCFFKNIRTAVKTLLSSGTKVTCHFKDRRKNRNINIRKGGGPAAVLLLIWTIANNAPGESYDNATELMLNFEDYLNNTGPVADLDAAIVGDKIRELTGNDSLGTWAALQLKEK